MWATRLDVSAQTNVLTFTNWMNSLIFGKLGLGCAARNDYWKLSSTWYDANCGALTKCQKLKWRVYRDGYRVVLRFEEFDYRFRVWVFLRSTVGMREVAGSWFFFSVFFFFSIRHDLRKYAFFSLQDRLPANVCRRLIEHQNLSWFDSNTSNSNKTMDRQSHLLETFKGTTTQDIRYGNCFWWWMWIIRLINIKSGSIEWAEGWRCNGVCRLVAWLHWRTTLQAYLLIGLSYRKTFCLIIAVQPSWKIWHECEHGQNNTVDSRCMRNE